jgi:hypothetical protein
VVATELRQSEHADTYARSHRRQVIQGPGYRPAGRHGDRDGGIIAA